MSKNNGTAVALPREGGRHDAIHYAERSIVSGAIRGDAACLETLDRLDPDALLDPMHRAAVEAVAEVMDRGEAPSLETVAASLLRTGRLAELSFADLSSITDTPPSLQPDERAAELMAAWSHRQLVDGLTRLSGMAQELPADSLRDCVGDLLRDLPPSRKAAIEPVNPLSVDPMPPPTFSHGPRPGTGAMMVGPSSSSKSFCGLQLALSGAADVPVLPSFTPSRPLRIQMWNFEDPPSALRDRICSIFTARPELTGPACKAIEAGALRFYFPEGPMFTVDARGQKQVTPLGAQVARIVVAEKPDHVFLDNLAVLAVVANEDNPTFSFIMGWVSRLAKQSGAVIWLIHHTNKAGSSEASQNSVRGGSSLVSGSRFAMMFTPIDESDPTNAMVRVTVVKNSYGPKPAPIILSRGPGGVLREEAKPAFDPTAVADTIGTWLAEHPTARVKETGINRRSPDGAELLSHLLGSLPWLSAHDIRAAVKAGLAGGLLRIETVDRSDTDRHKVSVLKPGNGGANESE